MQLCAARVATASQALADGWDAAGQDLLRVCRRRQPPAAAPAAACRRPQLSQKPAPGSFSFLITCNAMECLANLMPTSGFESINARPWACL